MARKITGLEVNESKKDKGLTIIQKDGYYYAYKKEITDDEIDKYEHQTNESLNFIVNNDCINVVGPLSRKNISILKDIVE